MSRREETLKHIQKLFASLPSEADGIIIDSYEGMEVGIRTYNYDVITRDGFYSGYWTESEPELSESEIISSITASEDCEYWEDMEKADFEERLEALKMGLKKYVPTN
ncbi:MAG: hypothetical protein HOG80_09835 [Candidatus Marinimicrobia bacterium]|nr:hypothetical protein [Candidatus Neomarinimicrobiota bacterium]